MSYSYVQFSQIEAWTTSKAKRFNKAEQYVLARFFDTDPFYASGWDIYHHETSTRDYFLLSVADVIAFFEHAYRQTGITKHLQAMTPKQLAMRLDKHDPPPTKVGHVTNKSEYDALVEKHGWKTPDNPTRRKDDKARKQRRAAEKRIMQAKSWRAQVETARRILGLGMYACAADDVDRCAKVPEALREYPMLIAVDVEAWERDRNKVTEIGISTLDTALIPRLQDLPALTIHDIDWELYADDLSARPRTRADVIVDLIQRRHIMIEEHRTLRNGLYVSDAADKFDFGKSEWVALADVPALLGRVFRHPTRKVMLVGHDVKQDLEYLRITGYDVWNIKNLEVLDTAVLHRAVAGERDPRSLSKVLMDLNVVFWNLHNAGNDAAYTLEAFVRLAEKGVPEPKDKPVAAATATAATTAAPATAPVLELETGRERGGCEDDGEQDEWEKLNSGGCVRWVDSAKDGTLGPLPPKKKSKNGGRKTAEDIAKELELVEITDAWASTPDDETKGVEIDPGMHITGWQ